MRRNRNQIVLVPFLVLDFWRGAASDLVKPWPTDAAQGVAGIADPEPDSGFPGVASNAPPSLIP
jgi:hypothetical protein